MHHLSWYATAHVTAFCGDLTLHDTKKLHAMQMLQIYFLDWLS